MTPLFSSPARGSAVLWNVQRVLSRVVRKCELGLLVNSGHETLTRCVDILMVISLLYIHVSRAVMEGKHLISLSSEALKYVFSTETIMSLNIKVPLWEPLVGNRTGSTQFFLSRKSITFLCIVESAFFSTRHKIQHTRHTYHSFPSSHILSSQIGS